MIFAIFEKVGMLVTSLLKGAGTRPLAVASSPAVKVYNSPVIKSTQLLLQEANKVTTFYPRDVVNVARLLQKEYPRLNVIDPRVLGCQAVVESGDVNNPLRPLATNLFHRDTDGVYSYGLMQVRTTTATDMYDRAGFRDFGRPDVDLLNISSPNIYFSLAVHADNYTRFEKNNRTKPSLQWMIQAYNGGYGNGRGGTSGAGRRVLAYYNKFNTVKNKIWNSL